MQMQIFCLALRSAYTAYRLMWDFAMCVHVFLLATRLVRTRTKHRTGNWVNVVALTIIHQPSNESRIFNIWMKLVSGNCIERGWNLKFLWWEGGKHDGAEVELYPKFMSPEYKVSILVLVCTIWLYEKPVSRVRLAAMSDGVSRFSSLLSRCALLEDIMTFECNCCFSHCMRNLRLTCDFT